MTSGQLRTRARVEGVIRLMAPALDVVLAVGDRVSRIVAPEDTEHYPVTRPARPDAEQRREEAR